MRKLSKPLKQHLNQETTTLAYCWRLQRKDGVVLGYTDCDVVLTIDGVEYVPHSTIDDAVETVLEDARITAEDIEAGLYDGAKVEVFLVNFMDVSQSKLSLQTGWIGHITYEGDRFEAVVHGLDKALEREIGELYSPRCRARLGDSRCGVDVSSYEGDIACDKRFSTCVERFNNAVNFRGEPHLPGLMGRWG